MSDHLDLRPSTGLLGPDLPHLHSDLPPARTGVLRGVRAPAAWFFRRQWRVHLHGTQHLPAGAGILAANHLGVIDGPLLVTMTPRPTFALAKAELFTGQLGRALEAVGQIPIHHRRADTLALRRAVKVLTEGHLLGIFPEGSRALGDMAVIRGGAVYLAMVTGAPIVPVALLGTREPGQSVKALPNRGATIHIVYGEPIAFDRTPWPRRQRVVAARTEEVRRQLAAHVAQAEVETGMALPGAPAPHAAT